MSHRIISIDWCMSRSVFLISSGVDINLLKSKISENPDSTIFTLDYEVHKLLERNCISHELAEDILNDNDLKLIDSIVIQTTNNFLKIFKSELSIEKVFLPELIEHEIYQYLLIEFLKPYTILKLIKNLKIYSIFNFTKYSNFVQDISKNFNIQFLNFHTNNTTSLYHDKIKFTINLGNFPLHFTISRKNFLRLKKFIQRFVNLIIQLEPDRSKKNNVMLVNFDPLEYSDLLHELTFQNVNFFLLNTRKPAITSKKSLDIVRYSKSKIIDLSKFSKNISDKIIFEQIQIKKNLTKIFNQTKHFEEIFSIDKISFWSDIEKSFSSICYERFNESIERILQLKELYSKYDVSLIFVWVDVGQEEKEAIMLGKEHSIESIMLQHGRLQTSKIWDKFAKFLGTFPEPLLSDKQIVWGNTSKNYALNYNHNPANIFIGGSPRHDKFFNFNDKKSEDGIIVLATTGTMYLSADSCVSRSQIKYDEYIKEIYKIVKSLHGKKLLIKPHPSQILRKYVQDLVDEIDPSIPVVESIPNTTLFNNCELLITFNNSTTALEALSLGTPVISLQTEKWATEDDIALSGAIVSISNIHDCENEIKKILFNKEFKDNLVEKGFKFITEYMHYPGTASENVTKILKCKSDNRF